MASQTNFEIPAEVGKIVMQKTIDASGLRNLTNVETISDDRDRVEYDLTQGDAKFHNPTSVDKVVDDGGIKAVEVGMWDLYIIKTVPDNLANSAPNLINALKETIPLKLAETLQKAIFGSSIISSSPFKGFGTPVDVDLTNPDAISELADSIDGEPTGFIFNRAAKGDLNKAFNAGANSNSLRDSLADGDLVHGVPAYFSSLGVPTTKLAGVVGDWNRSVLVIKDVPEFRMVDSSTSYSMMLGDSIALKVKIRVGFATANDASFKSFKKAA